MPIFNKLNEPIFLRESDSARQQLARLQAVDRAVLTKEQIVELNKQIKSLELGIQGEENVIFELKHSHVPMYVLHDMHLEHAGLTVQIDFIVITRRSIIVIECKNLSGNVEINPKGEFIIKSKSGKERGLYSPITQNQRKLDFIKDFCANANRAGIIRRTGFKKLFNLFFSSLIVFANDEMLLSDEYAKKNIKSKVIRRDKLIEYIKKSPYGFLRRVFSPKSSDKELKVTANFFLKAHFERKFDYAEKYRSDQDLSENYICPECDALLVVKPNRAGIKFWGCPNYGINCSGPETYDYKGYLVG